MLVAAFWAITGGLLLYVNAIDKVLTEQNEIVLAEITQQQIFNFDSKLRNDKMMLVNFANIIAKSDLKFENIVPLIREMAIGSDFEFLDYIKLDGYAVTIDGREMQLGDRDYFKQAIKGEVVVSEPVMSRIRNIMIVVVAAPIYSNGKVVGVVTGSYDTKTLSKLFLPGFEGTSYAYITNKNGEIITMSINEYKLSKANNLFDEFKKAEFNSEHKLENIKKNIVAGKDGYSTYSWLGVMNVMFITPSLI